MEYGEVCKSHSAITEFRAKLLALLPIASGSGIFLLLTKRSEPIDTTYLHLIGLFGFLITLGLFVYELRGIQHCKCLQQLASHLEEKLHLREGQFIRRPKARLGGFLGAEGAAYIIYPTMLIAWIVVAFVGFMSPPQKSTTQTPAEEAIRRLDNERIQAQIHADATALDRIYAADFIGVGPSGTVRTKPQVISDFTSGDLKFQSITTDEVQVRVYGNTAVETGRSTMIGQDKGQTVPRDTRFTRVWIKQQGRWRLVANHYSSQTMRQ